MRVNIKDVEDVQGFLPEGQYLCRLHDIEESTTQSGDEKWNLNLVVEEGKYKGRYFWDSVSFTQAAIAKAKLICSVLGLDVSGELDLKPAMLLGKSCYVTLIKDNEGRRRNRVPFDGYQALEQSATTEGGAAEEPPF